MDNKYENICNINNGDKDDVDDVIDDWGDFQLFDTQEEADAYYREKAKSMNISYDNLDIGAECNKVVNKADALKGYIRANMEELKAQEMKVQELRSQELKLEQSKLKYKLNVKYKEYKDSIQTNIIKLWNFISLVAITFLKELDSPYDVVADDNIDVVSVINKTCGNTVTYKSEYPYIPFNLCPNDYQPSGYINASRAREFYIIYDFNAAYTETKNKSLTENMVESIPNIVRCEYCKCCKCGEVNREVNYVVE